MRRQLLVVAAVAWGVRLLYALSIHDAYFFDHLQTEPQHYDAWADAIVSGTAPIHLPFDEAPVYPYLVAAIYALAGRGVIGVVLVQGLLDAGTCAAIALVARRFGGARAGWIAGGIAAVYGPLIYFTGQLEPATLAAFAVAGALAATPDGEASRRRWLLAGVAWSAAILVRSELVLALPVVAWHAHARGRRAVLAVALAPALVLAVSLTANLVASGHVVPLTTGSGVNLWLGNTAEADGVNPFLHGPEVAIAADVGASAGDAVEADARFRALAFGYVGDHPGAAIALAGKKLAWTVAQRELPNAADIDWQTRQSWLFHAPIFPLGFGVGFPLAVAGAWSRRRDRRRLRILVGPIVAGIVACVAMFTNARFRIVLVPPIVVLAALGIDAIVAARADRRRLAGALVAVALGAIASWSNCADIRHYRIAQIDVNTGVLERAAGRLDSAARHFEVALRQDPSDAGAWVQLGETLEAAGRLDAAHAAWADALRLGPDDPRFRDVVRAHLRP